MNLSFQRFTPDGERVISVGNEYDKAIAISNWRKLCTVSENRLTSKVCKCIYFFSNCGTLVYKTVK